ncbi:MAG: hypothetical protein BWZ01_01360 [Deltaproteobacteria bacterium ADurb.BinA179]|jgi:uncharacterized protein YdcH (DUF465 family)|nr:DUF465 domain-containing protein [Deltaproteobacteria bacterium]MDI9542169.1 DUF465 domain-containing protein [Pseudomonadota bacterium]NLW68762.1 DUF465 domain-containing protein [Bacteriovoracaceae bacterium]OPZ28070.1 MAG: hypothetical protein BWZ01_01360 [Deltaproteobacteria bacterium ADurb.BinA179]HRR20533.1 DUF465 domain-containing protein [Desulfomonilia bacterium]
MEETELQLIRRLIPKNRELKKLWDEHQDYEEKLEQLNKKRYLSTEEEMRRKEIQKLKLRGKDRIEEILRSYRDGADSC